MLSVDHIVALLAPRFALHGRISAADVASARDALKLIDAALLDDRAERIAAMLEEKPPAVEGVRVQGLDAGRNGPAAFFPQASQVHHGTPTFKPPSSPDDVGPSSHTLPSPQPTFGDAVPVSSPVPAR